MKIKPADGLKIRDPETKKHIEEGHEIREPISTYWHRRIACGDVIVLKTEAPKSAPKAKKEGA